MAAKKGKKAKKKAARRTGAAKPRKAATGKRTRKKSATRRRARPAAQAEEREDPDPLAGFPEDALILLAARGMLLFPHVALPIVVGRKRSIEAAQAAGAAGRPIGVLLQRDEDDDEPGPERLHEVGTRASIVRYVTAPDGSHHLIAQGEERFRVLEFLQTQPFLVARVEALPEASVEGREKEVEARLLLLKDQARQALALLPQKPEDLDRAVDDASDPAATTDLIATFMDIDLSEKQEILETEDLLARMDLVAERLAERVEVLSLTAELRERAKDKMDAAQREYFLREQLRQIQTELGEGRSVELSELARTIDRTRMPAAVKKEARRDLTRLERMHESSAEAAMLRSYLECLLELPWSKRTKDDLDIERARRVLDEDHHGLQKVKRRILEFLAVRKLNPTGKGPILCFVGPPGVGKTSLGRSIARALGRKFVRQSMGGVHDEAEVRGHRRTYVGAMPGVVMEHLRRAGTANPVFLLDELDKLGRGFHGDPSSALLEVLDPEQNRTFVDHYLNVPFDLSQVFFLGTANVLEDIPGPLRDRCEVIELAGYTRDEKLAIARRYLVGRQTENCGLSQETLSITDEALAAIVERYTREAGCRNLEREIGAVARWAAMRVAAGETTEVAVDVDDLATILGPVRYESELALRTSQPGVATGLAWTPAGGDVLFVEATSMPGKGELILTGQLGDVMKESARAALSLARSRAGELGIDEHLLEHSDVHLHVPAGAIPKDGPSAGVALYTAIVSLLTGRCVKSRVAMTGEISLRGLVLPVGGIKEKVLAAHQAGIETVLLPKRNRKDFEEIPANVREELRFLWIGRVDQALAAALEPAEEPETGRGGASARLSAREAPPERGS